MKEILKKYLKFRPLFLSLIRSKEAWLFQKYLPLKPPSFDLGCGDGFFAKTTFGKIDIGLDVTDSRIKEAEEQGVYKKLVVYNGRKIPLKSRSIKTVISKMKLHLNPASL